MDSISDWFTSKISLEIDYLQLAGINPLWEQSDSVSEGISGASLFSQKLSLFKWLYKLIVSGRWLIEFVCFKEIKNIWKGTLIFSDEW